MWILFVLMACQPVFKLDAPTCAEADVSQWGGLTRHLTEARTGVFDYKREEGLYIWSEGDYDLETGEFWIAEYYADDYWVEWELWEGHGTAWVDGDLDIVADVSQVIRGGDRNIDFSHRETRLGCEVTVDRYYEDGRAISEEGEFDSGEYVYEKTFTWLGERVTASGTRESNGDYEESLDHTEGGRSFVYDETSEDGVWRRDFEFDDGFATQSGFSERERDGTFTSEFTERVGGVRYEWSYSYDVGGNGSGTLEWNGGSCEVVWEDRSCDLESCDGSPAVDC